MPETDTPEEFTYRIGGKVYKQRKLVLGQTKQLLKFIDQFDLSQSKTRGDAMEIFGDKIHEGLAILLIPDGCEELWRKDLQAIARDIEWNIHPEVVFEVIDHFLSSNPMLVVEIIGRVKGPRETGTAPQTIS